jgi:hypothetical protein
MVVAVNPSGTEVLLNTVLGDGYPSSDLATLLRVDDDRALSTIRVARPAVAGLAGDGTWTGNTVVTTDGATPDGSTHPPPTLITLEVTGTRLRLESTKPFIVGGVVPMLQGLQEPTEPTFLDASGQQVAVWFSAIGELQYLDCDLLTSRCDASHNYEGYGVASLAGGATFLSNPSRPLN